MGVASHKHSVADLREAGALLAGSGVELADKDTDLVLQLVQLCNAMTGRPLTDDEIRLIAAFPAAIAELFPGQLQA